MKLPKARCSGRQVGAGQFGEVDPDLGPDPGLPFDLQAARQPGGGRRRGSGRQPSRVSTASVTPQTASRVRPGGGALGNQGIGRMGAEALRYAVDPGRVAEIPQNGQAGGLPGLTQEPGFGRFIVALERLGPTHQWPPWPRTSLLRWGPSGARPVRLIWLPPGGGRPLQGVRPGSDSQVRRTNTSRPARWAGALSVEAGLGHVDLVACQGWPGAYHVPFGGHQNEAAVDHLSGCGGTLRFSPGRGRCGRAPPGVDIGDGGGESRGGINRGPIRRLPYGRGEETVV